MKAKGLLLFLSLSGLLFSCAPLVVNSSSSQGASSSAENSMESLEGSAGEAGSTSASSEGNSADASSQASSQESDPVSSEATSQPPIASSQASSAISSSPKAQGASYTVTFHPSSTNSTVSISSNIANCVESDYEFSSVSASNVYGGKSGVRVSASSRAGSLTFRFAEEVTISHVLLCLSSYNSDVPSISVTLGEAKETQVYSGGESTLDFFAEEASSSESLIISSAAGNRFYLSSFSFQVGEVDPIYPTEISLGEDITLEVGKTATLSPVFTPSDTNRKGVSYQSSNEEVASVSGKGVVTAQSEGVATITCSSATLDGTVSDSVDVVVTPREMDDYTILVYLCGSNLESDSDGKLASANLKEMLSLDYPEGINVVIETGGTSKWWTSGVSASYTERFHIENRSLVLDEKLAKADMGRASTLESFLAYGFENYPAKQTGVILWDHGGAMTGVCFDENYNSDGLTEAEVHEAFLGAMASTSSSKVTWVGYDACLMSITDIASMSEDYASYFIASQESEPGEGWDYDAWLPAIIEDPDIDPVTLGTKICDTYYAKVAATYNAAGGTYRGYNDATLSLIDLEKWAEFDALFDAMGASVASYVTSSTRWNSLAKTLTSCQRFGYVTDDYGNNGEYQFSIYDADDFISSIANVASYGVTNASEILAAMNAAILCNKVGADSKGACGVSAFFPGQSNYTALSEYTASDTKYSSWRSLYIQYADWY